MEVGSQAKGLASASGSGASRPGTPSASTAAALCQDLELDGRYQGLFRWPFKRDIPGTTQSFSLLQAQKRQSALTASEMQVASDQKLEFRLLLEPEGLSQKTCPR